jgi:hypothetical protein
MAIPLEEKVWFVRKLTEERAKRSLLGRFFLRDVSNMSVEEAMGSPEGTVVTIVDTYHDLRANGASAAEALAAIEKFRSSIAPGSMPRGCGLEDYVKYRVRLEHRRGGQMSDFEIRRACSMTLGMIEKFFTQQQTAKANEEKEEAAKTADPYFMSDLPHLDVNRDGGQFRSGDALLQYYENPRTTGSVVAGIEPPYKYPQVIVASDDQRPLVIIRTEQNALGKLFLCSLDANGRHANWGEVTPMSRDDFVRRAGELLLQMKSGEEGRMELKTLADKYIRPSNYELSSRIASTIEAFIENGGTVEFGPNRLYVVIEKDYRVAITTGDHIKNARLAVPLRDLMLAPEAISKGPTMRHVAVDIAAEDVLNQLKKLEGES